IEDTKIDPRAAIPAAIPICRNVEFTPDAIPALAGGTTPIAVDASGGVTSPAPSPPTMNPGIRWGQSDQHGSPVISSSPTPTSSSPGPISQRAGTRSLTRPATTDVAS